METPEGEAVIFDPKAALIAGSRGHGKTSLAALMGGGYPGAVSITSVQEAIKAVESAIRAVAPWPETVTVHDQFDFGPRLIRARDYGYLLTGAEESKARAIRLAVKNTLGPVACVRLPDLLLVVGDRAVTSIWDDTVRQPVTG